MAFKRYTAFIPEMFKKMEAGLRDAIVAGAMRSHDLSKKQRRKLRNEIPRDDLWACFVTGVLKEQLDKLHKKLHERDAQAERDGKPIEPWNKLDDDVSQARCWSLEAHWFEQHRPYYNLWPVIFSMIKDVSLDIDCKHLHAPNLVLAIHPPQESSMLPFLMYIGKDVATTTDGNRCLVLAVTDRQKIQGGMALTRNGAMCHTWKDGITPQNIVNDIICQSAEDKKMCTEMIKVATAICVLCNSDEFITPVVLTKDLEEFAKASEERREQLARKAIKRTRSTGFDVGKDLEEMADEISRAPHIRRPHLCHFWTGKGRTTLVYKLRKGSLISGKRVTDVPTGYLDDEENSDD